jgi:hypothetical protein
MRINTRRYVQLLTTILLALAFCATFILSSPGTSHAAAKAPKTPFLTCYDGANGFKASATTVEYQGDVECGDVSNINDDFNVQVQQSNGSWRNVANEANSCTDCSRLISPYAGGYYGYAGAKGQRVRIIERFDAISLSSGESASNSITIGPFTLG